MYAPAATLVRFLCNFIRGQPASSYVHRLPRVRMPVGDEDFGESVQFTMTAMDNKCKAIIDNPSFQTQSHHFPSPTLLQVQAQSALIRDTEKESTTTNRTGPTCAISPQVLVCKITAGLSSLP